MLSSKKTLNSFATWLFEETLTHCSCPSVAKPEAARLSAETQRDSDWTPEVPGRDGIFFLHFQYLLSLPEGDKKQPNKLTKSDFPTSPEINDLKAINKLSVKNITVPMFQNNAGNTVNIIFPEIHFLISHFQLHADKIGEHR